VLGGAVSVGAGSVLAGAASASAATDEDLGSIDPGSIDAVVKEIDQDLVALRRDIHRHPELAGGEVRTSALVADRLRSAGLSVRTGVGGHGVVGILEGRGSGRTVAYRADMDSVPPDAQFNGGPVPAHLCGHDLHTTIGIGVAEVLARLRQRLSGRLVFFFQPGEENLSGARAMIDAGVLEWTRPEEIHALHCGPFPAGRFAVMPGTGLPGLDRGVITVPAADQAQRLTEEINALSTVTFSTASADLQRLVDEIQAPNGPLSRFVTCRSRWQAAGTGFEVNVSYRCWPEDRFTEVRGRIRRLAGRYAGAEVSFPADPFPAMLCQARSVHPLQRYIRHALGRKSVAVIRTPIPFFGEDFALFLRRVPGTFTLLGVRRPEADIATSFPHFGTFDPDEEAIAIGVRTMAGWLAQRTQHSSPVPLTKPRAFTVRP
jgi:amidohydrolase